MTYQEKYIELTATIRGHYSAIDSFIEYTPLNEREWKNCLALEAKREELKHLIKVINKLNK